MTEYSADLLQVRTLAQHGCGSGMSKHVCAAEPRLYSSPSDNPPYHSGYRTDLERFPWS